MEEADQSKFENVLSHFARNSPTRFCAGGTKAGSELWSDFARIGALPIFTSSMHAQQTPLEGEQQQTSISVVADTCSKNWVF